MPTLPVWVCLTLGSSNFPLLNLFPSFLMSIILIHRFIFFLLDNRLLSKVTSCSYDSIVFSDHAPTSIDVDFRQYGKPCRRWRFSSDMLAKETFKQFLLTPISFFFEVNDTPGTSGAPSGRPLKHIYGGIFISYISFESKTDKATASKLSEELFRVDNLYAAPDLILNKKRLQLRKKFDLISTNKGSRQIHCWILNV